MGSGGRIESQEVDCASQKAGSHTFERTAAIWILNFPPLTGAGAAAGAAAADVVKAGAAAILAPVAALADLPAATEPAIEPAVEPVVEVVSFQFGVAAAGVVDAVVTGGGAELAFAPPNMFEKNPETVDEAPLVAVALVVGALVSAASIGAADNTGVAAAAGVTSG